MFRDILATMYSLSAFLFLFIDIFTAYLYWIKIRVILNNENLRNTAVSDNIESVLARVLILTFFYLFCVLLFNAISYAITGLVRVVYSLAMYLMQDHNSKEYQMFLKLLQKLKVHWCCCCCWNVLKRQYHYHDDTASKMTDEQQTEKPKNQELSIDSQSADTKLAATGTGMELSVETKTVYHPE